MHDCIQLKSRTSLNGPDENTCSTLHCGTFLNLRLGRPLPNDNRLCSPVPRALPGPSNESNGPMDDQFTIVLIFPFSSVQSALRWGRPISFSSGPTRWSTGTTSTSALQPPRPRRHGVCFCGLRCGEGRGRPLVEVASSRGS